jgi:hypothetical protein
MAKQERIPQPPHVLKIAWITIHLMADQQSGASGYTASYCRKTGEHNHGFLDGWAG